MKNYIDRFSSEELRTLCIRHNWFNSGTCEQYERLFLMLENGASNEKLASMIWLCSTDENGLVLDLDEITAELTTQQAWPISLGFLDDTLRSNGWGEVEREIIREALTTHQDVGKAYRTI